MFEFVSVVGGGFMGTGIAEAVATAGLPVVVYDVDEVALARSRQQLDRSLGRAVAAGKLADEARVDALERIGHTTDLSSIAAADLVVEAVPEDEALKARVMRAIDAEVGPACVIASNTSSIPIAQLGSVVSHPERVLGLHFFSPVPVMRLVEIVRALRTDDDVIERSKAFVEHLGKQPIETKDRSGFIVNMLLVPYLMSAVRMYEDGFATREDIDDGMKLGAGHPMGPLTLCDFIGLDVLYAVCESLFEEFKRPEFAPPPLMKRMIAADHLGRKTGRGFYAYETQPAAAPATG